MISETLAGKNTFLQKLIEKTESLIQRMRWKAFFFLNNQDTDETTRQTYGLVVIYACWGRNQSGVRDHTT